MAKDTASYLTIGLLALLLIGSFTWMGNDVKVTTQQVDVSKLATKADVDALTIKVNELPTEAIVTTDAEDLWEDEAIVLATDEWSRNGYKDIFNVLENIDDKDDISKVVIQDSDVFKADEDDKDAKVVQEIKVYYEDESGDDKKVYLIVTTQIKDGEVDTQDIDFRE